MVAAALGIVRTLLGVDGISVNDDNGGRNGVISEGDRFTRVPAATLHAPRWWILVSSPVNTAGGGERQSSEEGMSLL